MRSCINLKSSTARGTQPASSEGEGNSSAGTPQTPGTSAIPSPTVNLSREYAHAVQTSSYSEIWSKIHVVEQWESEEPSHQQQLLLSQVLQPNREFVLEALKRATPTSFTQLISSYFEHSEKTCHLLLLLHHSIDHARSLYSPLHDLVDALPTTETESMSQLQCNRAFDVFDQFEKERNPFPCPDSHNFHEMRVCFSQLKQEVDLRLRKSRGTVHRINCGTTSSAICLIVTVVGVTISAVAIATHALVAIVAAASSCPMFLPWRVTQREMVHMGQLDAAARTAYVLHNDLDTIDRLVSRVYTAVEGDKLLIRLGLDRGRDKHPIYEVVKQLRKTRVNFMDQLTDLEEHICLCFAAINRARSLLLQQIDPQQEQGKLVA
ncbi:hypothetical protein RND81_03G082500 [Saponaria officinalis]|uniref:Uncharacterized protein n=1 Tax=Saponaria officinalis TaxID=3572 RepID=A0AAW1M3P0_SAPOF